MKRKKIKSAEGYSSAEMRVLMHAYIDRSAERLRKKLREAWKKQAVRERRTRHGVTV